MTTSRSGVSPVGMVNGYTLADRERQTAGTKAKLDRRAALLGPGYQLFYADPVEISHARDVHLYGPHGEEYLDAYNNVASVGHAHPAVAAAVSRQLSVVNTNTRYLQDGILEFSERLLATFPPELDRVTYTCTGSEANDLAVRIARQHTGGTGLIVTANAYHGVTATVAEFSPSLGPGNALGTHVRLVGAPGAGEPMRNQVRAAIADLARHGIKLCAFIADSVFSSDGVRTHPVPVLDGVADEVHAAGGLYIADEVQAGFGRTGEDWWGFRRHRVIPDLVTLGKPIGNGYPVSAVVLQERVGREFDRTVRYFNTFGGSTAAIAAAQAVWNVIEEQDLIRNARVVGAHLRSGLVDLAAESPFVSEIRGTGLFYGVEIVNPETAQPDGAHARDLVNALRHRHVLISASGPDGNVLKIRPPLTFRPEHVDRLLEALDLVLRAEWAR
ncbi:aspartate aminotransferase family protein [Amycolatopsis jejuensis]|uniref:aspartate aminotransferase family protein n=1 Tax=Amycolatopsis jejuensis TaxID=330084 RepID=UPI000AE52DA3|nr:aminotransferase class III-fold pyridoxal phosphate-dependent enzyme [Amycolatopsis jejuensis]